jgi:hypothetical protein
MVGAALIGSYRLSVLMRRVGTGNAWSVTASQGRSQHPGMEADRLSRKLQIAGMQLAKLDLIVAPKSPL